MARRPAGAFLVARECGQGSRSADGYGLVKREGRMQRVHRLVYHFTIGPLPYGMQIDHLCRTRACANVRHLDVVTGRENTMRGDTLPARNAAKTHCKRGHVLSGANLYRYSDGRRSCRICQSMHAQRYAAASREAA